MSRCVQTTSCEVQLNVMGLGESSHWRSGDGTTVDPLEYSDETLSFTLNEYHLFLITR